MAPSCRCKARHSSPLLSLLPLLLLNGGRHAFAATSATQEPPHRAAAPREALRGARTRAAASAIASCNPVADAPPLRRPASGRQCTVPIFVNASMNSYGDLTRGTYDPAKCVDKDQHQDPRAGGDVHGATGHNNYPIQAILDMHASVGAGTQYDRYGALWIGGVELLRMTTPEPASGGGVSWHVERDVTALLSYLARKHDAFVEVPNVVNKIYDGEIFVSASITLYFSDDNQASSPPPVVIGITAANVTKSSRLAAIGRSRIAYPFVSPVRNAVRAQALIFASGHACEEFWYSNLPTADAAPGACSGGAFRLLEVLLDGLVVGRASPFPVVYTGGINPLLWHPLTGILSFDIVPYAFDISPFVSIINDGGRHTLEVRVVTGEEGNRTADNVWFVDAEILLWRHVHALELVGEIANSVSKREVIINNEQRSHFRYAIDSDTSVPPVPPHELVIFARVRLERRREFELCTSNASKISWVSEMHGSALLNETLRSGNAALSAVTHPPQSSMRMSERFEVDSNDVPCYVLMRASVNGTCAPTPAPRPVDARACSFPHGVEMCGVELCSDSLAACCYG